MKNQPTIHALTRGPRYHLKSYYDMQPWSEDGRRFLCMETEFQDRQPGPDDVLTVGMVDLTDGDRFIPLAETRAWNFQQGCMLHWLPEDQNNKIIFNDRVDGDFKSVALDVRSKEKSILPQPIEAVSYEKNLAASLNFARWGAWRPGYGYAGAPDPFSGQNQPAEDAVYLMDLATGEHHPLVTLADVAALTSDNDGRKDCPMWFCHLMFNPSGDRLIGLVRWWAPELAREIPNTGVNIDGAVPERRHGMWMINTDGTGLEIIANDALVSHAEWRDDDHILYWGDDHVGGRQAYRLVDVRSKRHQILGEGFLTEDGHMSYHRDKRWLLTDTYPDENLLRTLKIYDVETNREIVLGKLLAPPDLQGELRCDLHPCWSRDCAQVAIDSIHDQGQRQVYVVDVSELA